MSAWEFFGHYPACFVALCVTVCITIVGTAQAFGRKGE